MTIMHQLHNTYVAYPEFSTEFGVRRNEARCRQRHKDPKLKA